MPERAHAFVFADPDAQNVLFTILRAFADITIYKSAKSESIPILPLHEKRQPTFRPVAS